MYDISVFIGRFQPFHKGHLHNVLEALLYSQKIIINVGSSFAPSTIKNPFSFSERKALIVADLLFEGIDILRFDIEPLADYFYEEDRWLQSLRRNVYKHVSSKQSIALVGHEKDESSYYLKSFPEWGFIPVNNYHNYNATDFRDAYYKGEIFIEYMCSFENSQGSHEILQEFMATHQYAVLKKESEIVFEYKNISTNIPKDVYSDDVVLIIVCDNKLLLSKRDCHPGLGLYTLPIGNISENCTIDSAMIHKLRELHIGLTDLQIETSIKHQVLFDHSSRSVLGLVRSHVVVFTLSDMCGDVIYSNELDNQCWVDTHLITQTMCDRMYMDHYQIICILLAKEILKIKGDL